LSWLDWSLADSISKDGSTILFDESGEGGGAGYSTYARKMDGSPAIRLGEGSAQSLSPDGRQALAIVHTLVESEGRDLSDRLGDPKLLETPGLTVQAAAWLPDGNRVLLAANEAGRGVRIYLYEIATQKSRALTPEGYRITATGAGVSPDGKLVAVFGPDRKQYLYPLEGGEPTALPIDPKWLPVGWSDDGGSLFVRQRGQIPAQVERLDLKTGTLTPCAVSHAGRLGRSDEHRLGSNHARWQGLRLLLPAQSRRPLRGRGIELSLAAGTRLGPYEIVGIVGSGGMGEVYRARDERLKRDVAIKVLPASFAHDADRLRRFEQEAQSAGGLNHPNITAVHDLGTHDGAPYIVTELLEGETLRARLSGGALSPRKAIDYAVQIAKGLAAAHEKGIVHRDLKPENVFLTSDGRVKILDFGLAKLTQSEAPPARRPTSRRPRAQSRASSWGRSGTCRPSR
jgi:hypothetical protein